MYTAHQFVRLDVAAEVEGEGEGTQDVKETTTEEMRTQDAQVIKMLVDDKHKLGGLHRNNKTFTPKGTKRTRSCRTRTRHWGGVACPKS